MKKNRLTRDTSNISGNGVIFRVAAYGVFLAVILCGGCSDSAIGTVVGESKIPSIPLAPSNVSAAAASSSGIALSWPKVSLAAGYKVYRGTNASDTGSYEHVGTALAVTSYTDTGLSSGTSYFYKVSAYNDGGESLRSRPASAITVPDAPLGVSVRAVSRDDITISWPSVFGATGYYVYRSTNVGERYSEKVGTTSSTTYTNEGVLPGTVYYYKVSAYNTGGESAQSSHDSALTVPAAPLIIETSSASSGSVTLRWQSVFGADGYNVYRDMNANGSYDNKVGTTISGTSYTDTGLASGVTYYYRVSAYNNIGEGVQSRYDSATTEITEVPVVSVTAESSNSIKISWTSVFGANGYYVYRGTTAAGPYNRVETATSSASAFVDNGLLSCTMYYYKVSAYNNTGEGKRSDCDSVITAPNPPSSVTVFAESSSEIAVSWGSSSCATGYNVYRSSTENGTYSRVGTAASTSYTHTGLIWDTRYCYRVSAKNSGGESDKSSPPSCATTRPDPEIIVTASAATPSSITVKWTSVSGADGYYVYRSTNGLGYDKIRTTSSTTYTDNGRVSGMNYCYKVSAYAGADKESPMSSESCATPLDTFTDTRDDTQYKVVRINNKLWMAENMNYEMYGDSWCYGDDESKCGTYGRLYSWTVAKEEVCPEGWHLPSRAEWGELAKAVGGTGTYGAGGAAGTELKLRTGWNMSSGTPVGTNSYGFSALPGGYYLSGEFSNAGAIGYWWTASEDDNGDAYCRSMKYDNVSVSEDINDKSAGMSVRCVKDN